MFGSLIIIFWKDVKTHDLSKMLYYNTFSKSFLILAWSKLKHI